MLLIAGTYNASPELREVPSMLFPVAIPPDNYKITHRITRLYTDEMYCSVFGRKEGWHSAQEQQLVPSVLHRHW